MKRQSLQICAIMIPFGSHLKIQNHATKTTALLTPIFPVPDSVVCRYGRVAEAGSYTVRFA